MAVWGMARTGRANPKVLAALSSDVHSAAAVLPPCHLAGMSDAHRRNNTLQQHIAGHTVQHSVHTAHTCPPFSPPGEKVGANISWQFFHRAVSGNPAGVTASASLSVAEHITDTGMADALSPQSVANIVWGHSRLSLPHEGLLQSLAGRIVQKQAPL